MSSFPLSSDLLRRNARYLLAAALIPSLASLAVSLLMPREYLSKTSILPANSRFSDRSRFANTEIKELYSAFGSGDDLDRLYATLRSHPVMMHIVDSFGLVGHYRLQNRKERAREAALQEFRENCSILKTEYGEIHIRVWDRDRDLAAGLANAMVARAEKVHQDLYRDYFSSSLQKLETAYLGMDKSIRTGGDIDSGRIGADTEVMRNYLRSISEYRMALLNPPPSLMVLEKAIPSVKHDRPKVVVNVLAAAVVGLFTGLAALLLLPFLKRNPS
jgi:hypothetical protein